MNRMRLNILVFWVMLEIVMSGIILPVHAQLTEIDATADVWTVIDGDTFDAFPVGRIRMADINAPDSGEIGYAESKSYLTNLIENEQVYLDVDDDYMDDTYKRLVCLVYIRYNSTHLLNVNQEMVSSDYAEISDYSNEFHPYTWTRYVYYPTPYLPERTYSELRSDYMQLQEEYDAFTLDYEDLETQYLQLNSTHHHLQTDYQGLQTQYEQSSRALRLYQPLSHGLIICSVLLVALLIKRRL